MPWNSYLPSNPLTMNGMIEKSSRVLDQAAKMDRNGSLSLLFQRAKGIVLISVVESAIGITGAIGSGICLAKDEKTGKWSPPCACGMAAQGYGFALGAVVKDIIIFAFDDKSVSSFASKVGLKMTAGTSVALGTYGISAGANLSMSRSGAEGSANVANHSVGGTVSIAFSKGAFVAAAVSGSVVGPRDHVNHVFYADNKITAQQILFEADKGLLENNSHKKEIENLQEVYKKLDLLTTGATNRLVQEVAADPSLAEVPQEAPMYIDNLAAKVTKELDEASAENSQIQLNEELLSL